MGKLNLFREIESMIDKKIRENNRNLDADIHKSLEQHRIQITDVRSDVLSQFFRLSSVEDRCNINLESIENLKPYEMEIALIKEILRDIVPDYKKHDPGE